MIHISKTISMVKIQNISIAPKKFFLPVCSQSLPYPSLRQSLVIFLSKSHYFAYSHLYSFLSGFFVLVKCFEIHVVVCLSGLFLFLAEYYSILWMYHNLLIHSNVNIYLSCFQIWVIMNKADMNIFIKIFLRTYVFIYFT